MAKELLFSVTKKDLKIETFRAGGHGGQNQNKRDTGVRVKHPPSGAVGESREERSQLQNKQVAFKRMTETKQFQAWLKLESARVLGRLDEDKRNVERAMDPRNIRVDRKDDKGRWMEWKDALQEGSPEAEVAQVSEGSGSGSEDERTNGS